MLATLPSEVVRDPAPGNTLTLVEEREALCGALVELPANRREVIELAYFGGLARSEIPTTCTSRSTLGRPAFGSACSVCAARRGLAHEHRP